jgi:SAM-dependent methyltransferase
MWSRDRRLARIARQLGRPEGVRGRMVGRSLNRSNRATVTAAVAATGLQSGQVGADIGFGGGVGLALLRRRVGPGGHVHGVELSTTMLSAARRRYDRDVTAGRMTLQSGRLEELPVEDGQVDGLITVNTLYFVEDVDAVFRELVRVLSPSGSAVIGVGDPTAMAGMPVTAHGFRVRPLDELIAGLRGVGLDVRHERAREGERAPHLVIATRQVG